MELIGLLTRKGTVVSMSTLTSRCSVSPVGHGQTVEGRRLALLLLQLLLMVLLHRMQRDRVAVDRQVARDVRRERRQLGLDVAVRVAQVALR